MFQFLLEYTKTWHW